MNSADDDQAGQSHIGRADEDRFFRVAGDDGFLAAALEEIIPGLQNRGTHTTLHTRNQLPVDTGHQNAEYHTEQQTGENQKLDQID